MSQEFPKGTLLKPLLVAAASCASSWPAADATFYALPLAVALCASLHLGARGAAGALVGVFVAHLGSGFPLAQALAASLAVTVPAAAGASLLRREVPLRGSVARAFGVAFLVAVVSVLALAVRAPPASWIDLLHMLPRFFVAAVLPVATVPWTWPAAAGDARRGFLAAVLDALPAVVFMKDTGGRYTIVNRRFEKFFGRQRGEILGRTDRDLFPKDVAERFEKEDRTVISTQQVVEVEQPIPERGEPHVYLVSKFPLLGGSGVPLAVGGVATDVTERVRLTRAVQESEGRLREVIESSSNLFYVHTADRVFTYVSPQSRHYFDCDPEEAKVHWDEFVADAASRARARESTARAILTGERQPAYEIELTTRSGRTLWVEVNEAPVVREGRTVAVAGALTDIDERRRAEQGLRRVLSLLTATLEASADALLVVDRDGYIRRFNQRFVEMWTIPGEILSSREDERMVEIASRLLVDPAGFVARVREVYARLEEDSFDVVYFRDGRVIERYSRPQRLDGEVVGRVWSFRDVTAQRKAEEGLRAVNETLRAIIEAAPVAILTLDAQGLAQSWNPAAERIFGYTAAEILGRPPLFVADEQQADFEVNIAAVIREGRSLNREVIRRRKDGSPVYVHLHAAPVRDASGAIAGLVAILMDTSARHLAEAELRRHRDHLAELVEERTRELSNTNRELETFCYTVSHDLRAPLRAIDGFTRILGDQARGHLDEPAVDSLGRIRGAVGRMSRLIDDLLELSRVSRCELRVERVELATVAAAVVAELRAGDPTRRVAVVIEAPLVAEGDPGLLRSLLQNLLDNAWKFSAVRPLAHITVGAKDEAGERVFFVRDDGAGFDMAYQARLFAPFERLHGPNEFEGTGIGLATVLRIVQRHGGRVWADAELGRGATFYFTLAPRKGRDTRA